MGNLTHPWWEHWANHWPEEWHATITSTSTPSASFMLLPIFPPLNGRSFLAAYHCSNQSGSAVVVNMWDQYINDPSGFTTAGLGGTRGSNAAPVWTFQVPAGADIDVECVTRPYWQCAVAVQPGQQPIYLSLRMYHSVLG